MIRAVRCNKDPLILNGRVGLVRHPNPAHNEGGHSHDMVEMSDQQPFHGLEQQR